MANFLYQNKKIYKKIQDLSKEIQENIELLEKQEKQEKPNQLQRPKQTQYPNKLQNLNPDQNIILTISDNESIIIKKDTKKSTLTTSTTETKATETKATTETKETTKNLNHEKPPAGRAGTKWDPTIIQWKNSLRGQYFFNNF